MPETLPRANGGRPIDYYKYTFFGDDVMSLDVYIYMMAMRWIEGRAKSAWDSLPQQMQKRIVQLQIVSPHDIHWELQSEGITSVTVTPVVLDGDLRVVEPAEYECVAASFPANSHPPLAVSGGRIVGTMYPVFAELLPSFYFVANDSLFTSRSIE